MKTIRLTITLAVLFLPHSLQAEDYSWIGGVDVPYATASNQPKVTIDSVDEREEIFVRFPNTPGQIIAFRVSIFRQWDVFPLYEVNLLGTHLMVDGSSGAKWIDYSDFARRAGVPPGSTYYMVVSWWTIEDARAKDYYRVTRPFEVNTLPINNGFYSYPF